MACQVLMNRSTSLLLLDIQ